MHMNETIQLEDVLLTDTILEKTIEDLKHLKLTSKEYVNIANALLDLAINGHRSIDLHDGDFLKDMKLDFPIRYDDIVIEKIKPRKHKKLLQEWTESEYGKEFLLSRIDNVERSLDDLMNDESNIFGIIETKDKTPIGVMGYLNYDKENNKAELRKLIGDTEYTHKGLGKKASEAWISYGLHTLKIRKIYIYTFDTNLRNIRINRELGFNLEGIFKAENIYNGAARDILRMSLITK